MSEDKRGEHLLQVGLSPLPVTVANEGLVRDPLLKCNNPGGDWHPGRGDNPNYKCLKSAILDVGFTILDAGFTGTQSDHRWLKNTLSLGTFFGGTMSLLYLLVSIILNNRYVF